MHFPSPGAGVCFVPGIVESLGSRLTPLRQALGQVGPFMESKCSLWGTLQRGGGQVRYLGAQAELSVVEEAPPPPTHYDFCAFSAFLFSRAPSSIKKVFNLCFMTGLT